ncbi:hypothetical protein KDD30_10855 [Photobacterium sp. GJ3]|uniref:hypothetical protein n=1 Tax=Photobacterium sp. GJ3 TaxID=2829502 RepID=UPI001B8C1D21|nr:hypothetical protein [Photobacterium sp. GJ3]QUJ66657.1 hypothetical protein KDD30_10855 [Photobacterium sp. GJ3]
MIEQRYQLPAIDLSRLKTQRFSEAYLEFYGLNHLRPTYTAWIFFASKLPKKVTPESRGFAGTLSLFGHSECWGASGHCHGPDGIRRFDSRPSHPMTPAFKRVPVTHALLKALKSDQTTLSIWIYAFSRETWRDQGDRSLVCCHGVQLVTL